VVDLPSRPVGRPSPRELLALLEAHLGGSRAVALHLGALRDLGEDDVPDVRRAAARALGRLATRLDLPDG
jgi:HEAT repeat protein